MAGDRRVDIFTAERDYLRAPTVEEISYLIVLSLPYPYLDWRILMAKGKMPPQLLEYFKNKNKKKDESGEKMTDKEKRERSFRQG